MILTNLLTHFTGQSPPWEADSHSAIHQTLRLLWNPKVPYRVHKSPPLVPILSQMHPVSKLKRHFPKIHSNIILPSMPRSSEWSLIFIFFNQNFVCISRFSHASFLWYKNWILLVKKCESSSNCFVNSLLVPSCVPRDFRVWLCFSLADYKLKVQSDKACLKQKVICALESWIDSLSETGTT
jgi:hypothetical protein